MSWPARCRRSTRPIPCATASGRISSAGRPRRSRKSRPDLRPAGRVPTCCSARAAGAGWSGAGGRDAGPPVDAPGGTVRTLVRGERAMLPVEYTGAPGTFDEYICHDGEEFVYVVRGVIELDIEGKLHRAAA